MRLQRDFGRILRNFVNFSDFYAKQDGVFQAGTLYLDARALHLCVPVADAAKHGALAARPTRASCIATSRARARPSRSSPRSPTAMSTTCSSAATACSTIATATTGTRRSRKIVNNPISVRAAFWAPYKKLVGTIEDKVAKRAQAAEADARDGGHRRADRGRQGGDRRGREPRAGGDQRHRRPARAEAAPTKIDLGTIAAIGVAIGGIGTLFGALLAKLFGLGTWLPLGIVALLLMISGPSMLLAWLKLRRRNLGPILDANGWAINGRARINVAFGAAMTELAALPAGRSARSTIRSPSATPWKR